MRGGLLCAWCQEPIVAGEDVPAMPLMLQMHRECAVRMIFGSAAHQSHVCSCVCVGARDDQEFGLTKRQAAQRAANVFYDDKRFAN